MRKFLAKNILYIAWIQSIAATLGSLYYSEIQHFTPCPLCWYQRIFMYPLVLILPIGILQKDTKVYQYVLPLSIIGWLIALYQILLQGGILPETVKLCTVGISCATKYTIYFGFITIPMMSLIIFTGIIVCMSVYRNLSKKQ